MSKVWKAMHKKLPQDDANVRLVRERNKHTQPVPPTFDRVREFDEEASEVVDEEFLRREEQGQTRARQVGIEQTRRTGRSSAMTAQFSSAAAATSGGPCRRRSSGRTSLPCLFVGAR